MKNTITDSFGTKCKKKTKKNDFIIALVTVNIHKVSSLIGFALRFSIDFLHHYPELIDRCSFAAFLLNIEMEKFRGKIIGNEWARICAMRVGGNHWLRTHLQFFCAFLCFMALFVYQTCGQFHSTFITTIFIRVYWQWQCAQNFTLNVNSKSTFASEHSNSTQIEQLQHR